MDGIIDLTARFSSPKSTSVLFKQLFERYINLGTQDLITDPIRGPEFRDIACAKIMAVISEDHSYRDGIEAILRAGLESLCRPVASVSSAHGFSLEEARTRHFKGFAGRILSTCMSLIDKDGPSAQTAFPSQIITGYDFKPAPAISEIFTDVFKKWEQVDMKAFMDLKVSEIYGHANQMQMALAETIPAKHPNRNKIMTYTTREISAAVKHIVQEKLNDAQLERVAENFHSHMKIVLSNALTLIQTGGDLPLRRSAVEARHPRLP